jgi:hypothetical protein
MLSLLQKKYGVIATKGEVKTGNKMAVFHLEQATALDIPVMGDGEKLL